MPKKHPFSAVNFKVIGISALVILLVCVVTVLAIEGRKTIYRTIGKTPYQIAQVEQKLAPLIASPSASPVASPSPTPTPTPRPLTFEEMNQLYGPCVSLPTLMYHHVQDLATAETEGHKSLTVDPKFFQAQMQYLKDRGYTVIPMSTLISFFDSGATVPKKSVLLTFDDGYDDFGSVAAPILQQFGFAATLFVPTGLMQNPGYLSWSRILELSSTQPILMANHTWSHHNMGANRATIEKEITTADKQLTEKGLDTPKVFAYPYGIESPYAEAFLNTQGYKLAFTTVHGRILCAKQRFSLPRIRIGNASLSAYGL